MIDRDYVTTMAAYNSWQNRSLYAAADALDDATRRADRGAFFGSIHATLNHILWADQMWMGRFTGEATPATGLSGSVDMHEAWPALQQARSAFDAHITAWAEALHPDWLRHDLTWTSGALGREVSRPRALLVTHMFNHQTHHRGQVHAMLTACGQRPEATDLAFMSR